MGYMSNYESWLKIFENDQETVAELKAIAGDEKEIEDRFYTDLSFGTAGMRGVLGAGTNRMNKYNIRRATQGLANFIIKGGYQNDGVAIGYDSRRMSTEFALETALTLAKNGIKAYLYDALRPVALLSFAVRHLKCIAGVVITASHNPKQYNGYKVYWRDGGQLPPERADEVLACIREVSYEGLEPMDEKEAIEKGLLVSIGSDIDEEYYKMVLGLGIQSELCKERGSEISIVYTPLNGSGNVPVREVLKRAGFTNVFVVAQQENPDPEFTTVGVPNPENRDAFKLALELAESKQADLVFATDPDCDRVGVAAKTAQGDYVLLSGNQIGCLLAQYIFEGLKELGRLPENGAIVKSIVSTELARIIADDFNVTTFNVLTGFKFIGEKIEQFLTSGSHSYLLGFEESYGYLSGVEVRDKDGVNASLLLAECALWHKTKGRTLYEGLCAIYDKYGWGLESVKSYALAGVDGAATMKKVMKYLRDKPASEFAGVKVLNVKDYLEGIDGLPKSDVLYYELLGGSWVCVRPSGTEPKIKLYINVIEKTRESAENALPAIMASADAMMNAAIES
ncbi:MAG: phospho-sugar mutase [Clostridia bacterium]|nr:phospho-sugar mutase [Clostridia bacterium]